MNPYKIKLNRDDVAYAAMIAVERRLSSIFEPKDGPPYHSWRGKWHTDTLGAIAERAVTIMVYLLKWVDQPPALTVNAGNAPDVLHLDVKSIEFLDDRLAVGENGTMDRVYLMVQVDEYRGGITCTMMGWAMGHEVMVPERKEKLEGGSYCYFMRPSDLHPMETLPRE